ncbi:MAG: flippase-like domain-containing protein [Candidatus Omnitrophica bacterium]|nr:flippase-like domain-containing protein [Candidatus Omnitrophota bacterium]
MQERKLRLLRSFFTLIVTIAIFFALFSKIDAKGTISAIKGVNLKLFLLATIIALMSNLFLMTDRWRQTLRMLGSSVPYRELLFVRVGSYSLRGILPLKSGEILRVAYLKKYNKVSLPIGTASVGLGLLLNLLALFAFVLGGSLFLGTIEIVKKCGYVLVLLLLAFILFRSALSLLKKISRKVYKAIEEYLRAWKRVSFLGKTNLFFYSLGLKFLELLNYYIILRAFNIIVPFKAILVFVPLAILVSELPITIAGLGIRESAVVLFFSQYGLAEELLGAGLLISFVEYILPNLICLSFTKPFLDKMATMPQKA